MGPKEWRRGGAALAPAAAKAIGDLLCGRHCGKGGRSAAPRAPPKKRASTPKAETTPSRKSSRAGSEHKPGMYAISRTGRSRRRSPAREKEQARLEKLLKRADRAVANAAVLQEQRRILFQHQAILRAQQLEVLRQQRVQEREERERQVEEDRRAAALKRDAEKAARVADKAMAAMAARDARRAAKFVKEMAKSQRSTELQRQRVESKVYRESLAQAKARSKLAKTQKSSDAAQQADAIASESTVSVILEREARRTARRPAAPGGAAAASRRPSPRARPRPGAPTTAPAPSRRHPTPTRATAASSRPTLPTTTGGDFGPPPPLGPPPEAPRYAYASASYAAERAPPDGGVSYERGAPRSPAAYCPSRRGRAAAAAAAHGRGPVVPRALRRELALALGPAALLVRGAPRARGGRGLADHDAQDATTVGRLLGAASGRWCPHCERFDPNALDGYVSCDGCNNWWHPACAQLDDETRAWLAAHEGDPTATWHCPLCEARRAALENQVVCVCKASAASCQNTFMLMCDACDVWHHPACVGLSASGAGALGESDARWHCPTCVAAGIICVCQARGRPGEVTLTCEGCAGEFHPKCVNVADADVAAYGKPASDPDRKILICPACYDANRRSGAATTPATGPGAAAEAPRGRKRCHGEPSGLSVRVAVSPKGARTTTATTARGSRSPLPHGLWPEPVVVRYTALEPSPRRRPRRPAARMTRPATRRTRPAARPRRRVAAPADADAAVAEAPADADAAMAEAPADATVEVADAEPPVADAMEDDSEAPLDV
ncbi:SET domain-containing protein [Aureococcus anophagefferens]|nr:SET domain-containing protein [Aureococcus anophagefferens]